MFLYSHTSLKSQRPVLLVYLISSKTLPMFFFYFIFRNSDVLITSPFQRFLWA